MIHENPAVLMTGLEGGALEASFSSLSQLSTYNFFP